MIVGNDQRLHGRDRESTRQVNRVQRSKDRGLELGRKYQHAPVKLDECQAGDHLLQPRFALSIDAAHCTGQLHESQNARHTLRSGGYRDTKCFTLRLFNNQLD